MTSSGSSKHCQTQNQSVCCGWLPIQATNDTAPYCRLISLLPRAPEDFSVGSMVKNPPANAGDTVLILGLGRSPEGGHSNPLQHSCLENSMDRGAWPAIVQRVAKVSDRTERLNDNNKGLLSFPETEYFSVD